jgi:uncharacterized protein
MVPGARYGGRGMALWPAPVWLSAALDAALLVWVVTRPGGGAVARAALVAAVAWAAKLAALVALGLDPGFGAMHVVYLDAVVALPIAGAALVWRAGRRGRWLLRLAGLACLALAPVGAYASFVEPSRLAVERATVRVPAERAGSEPVRIAILADLQFTRVGEHEREAVERAVALRPDVILLPGDVHQGEWSALREELPEIRALLRRLGAAAPAVMVQGDVEDVTEARLVTEGTGVELLVNELRTIGVRGRRIAVAGLELDYRSPGAFAAVGRLERLRGREAVRILLAHRPDPVLDLRPGTRVDLVVAGHTHGGQVQLPLIGPPITATKVPREVAGGGLHSLGGGRRIYVSRGIGLERVQAPRVRFGAVPEVSLLTLAG